MELAKLILLRVVILPVCGYLFAQTVFSLVHAFGWYPEKQIAEFLLTVPSVWHIEWARDGVLFALTAASWVLADHFLYRRHLRAAPKSEVGSKDIPEDKPSSVATVTQYLPSTAPVILLNDGWILNFNPEVLIGRKIISFNPDGKIGEGRNRNEYTWSMVGSELEIRRQNGDLQNRFSFDPQSNKFISTNHPDAKGIRDQFIFRDGAHKSP